ncbi:8189_t:CDS:2 [Funneliformis caledonium]|uniref:8189_t:CDS:1 n=1 Tax=Funneliformis caledonium TaxID=1117310 RepID=A0A9N8WH66_9GLOM|nr:8189_t:CDS:2 [Funneliformis caledonium]
MIIVEEISPNDKKVHETIKIRINNISNVWTRYLGLFSSRLPILKELDKKISVSYSWQNITKANTTFFVYSNKVYDPSNEDNLFGNDSVTEWLRGLLGKDATREILHTRRYQNVNLILKQETFKFISAIEFDWFLSWQLAQIINGNRRWDITGPDNDKTTPEICEDLIEPFNLSSFDLAIGKMAHQKNEKGLKSGKRDSQLILMEWLSNIFFNEQTLVMKDSVSRMVAVMERDPTVMGLCGETKIANKKRVGLQ